jgi:hypothetical protein
MADVPEDVDIPAIARSLQQFAWKLWFPRLAGTPGERRGKDIIEHECARAGISYVEEPFPASSFFMFRINKIPYFLLGCYTCAIVVWIAMTGNLIVAAIGGAIILVLGLSIEAILHAIKYPAMYSRFARKFESSNIVLDRLGPAGNEKRPVTLLFLAHSDTKSETPDPHVYFVYQAVAVIFGSLVLAIHAEIYAFASWALGHPIHPAWIFLYGLAIGIVEMSRIRTRYMEGDSPGANDDAIGVGILIEIAKCLKDALPANINVVPIVTGSEEMGEAGAHQYLAMHAGELSRKEDHFFVLDGLTEAHVQYFTSFGLQFKPFSPLIRGAFEGVVAASNAAWPDLVFKRQWMPPPIKTDHSAIVKDGFPAFLLASVHEPVSHSARDTAEKIDYTAMAEVAALCLSVIREIDASSRSSGEL